MKKKKTQADLIEIWFDRPRVNIFIFSIFFQSFSKRFQGFSRLFDAFQAFKPYFLFPVKHFSQNTQNHVKSYHAKILSKLVEFHQSWQNTSNFTMILSKHAEFHHAKILSKLVEFHHHAKSCQNTSSFTTLKSCQKTSNFRKSFAKFAKNKDNNNNKVVLKTAPLRYSRSKGHFLGARS